MGFLDKLFDKKTCSICGGEIGLLGNRKLADGNLCKECASKLSPLFSERRESTVEQIREQLDYRAANEGRVAAFNVTKTFGNDTKMLVDEGARAIVVSSSSRWRSYNPDVVDLDQVTGCDVDVRESKTEIRRENPDGTKESYDPPRYDVDYNVYVTIYISSPYFDQISFRVNDDTIEHRTSREYVEAVNCANEIRAFLTGEEFVPEELPRVPLAGRPPAGVPTPGRPAAVPAGPHARAMAGGGAPTPAQPSHQQPPTAVRSGGRSAGVQRPAQQAGAPAAPAPRFCPQCGQPLATPAPRFCPQCGARIG